MKFAKNPPDGVGRGGDFDDPEKLLAVVDAMGLEGIVSKKRTAPYLAGSRSGWSKVKTATWREANRDRREMFR